MFRSLNPSLRLARRITLGTLPVMRDNPGQRLPHGIFELTEEEEDCHVLHFFNKNQSSWPVLACMACVMLAVQPPSAASYDGEYSPAGSNIFNLLMCKRVRTLRLNSASNIGRYSRGNGEIVSSYYKIKYSE